MRSKQEQQKIFALLEEGKRKCEISKLLDISYGTIRDYENRYKDGILTKEGLLFSNRKYSSFEETVTRIQETVAETYVYILGIYLGDGYIDKKSGTIPTSRMRIYMNLEDVELIQHICSELKLLFPDNVVGTRQHVSKKAPDSQCTEIRIYNKHIWDLFPRDKGKKLNKGAFYLHDWQRQLIDQHPKALIKGLIQSDGSRIKASSGTTFYQFNNFDEDIKDLFCQACDQVNIYYTRPKIKVVNFFTKKSVAELDEFIIPRVNLRSWV